MRVSACQSAKIGSRFSLALDEMQKRVMAHSNVNKIRPVWYSFDFTGKPYFPQISARSKHYNNSENSDNFFNHISKRLICSFTSIRAQTSIIYNIIIRVYVHKLAYYINIIIRRMSVCVCVCVCVSVRKIWFTIISGTRWDEKASDGSFES